MDGQDKPRLKPREMKHREGRYVEWEREKEHFRTKHVHDAGTVREEDLAHVNRAEKAPHISDDLLSVFPELAEIEIPEMSGPRGNQTSGCISFARGARACS